MTLPPKLPTPEEYGISSDRGVLPKPDPLRHLPPDFSFYDEIGKELPDLLGSGIVRKRVRELPVPRRNVATLSVPEKRLLMVRLAFLVSGYRYAYSHLAFAPHRVREALPKEEEVVIPHNIARPFVETARVLGVPPILSYSFYCLSNWERIEPKGPIAFDNLKLLQHFLGGLDERHFILVHTEIERHLGPALHVLPRMQDAVRNNDTPTASRLLWIVAEAEENAIETMEQMVEGCHPDVYYLRVRPYIFGFNLPGSPGRVVFEGIKERMPVLRGETGAQTPSWPTLWAAMGIEFSEDALKHYVRGMRDYLMPHHRAYLETIEQGASVREFARAAKRDKQEGWNELVDAYNHGIDAMERFFRLHLRFANEYIAKKSSRYVLHPEQAQYGTGGTPFIRYLTSHCNEIHAHLL